MGELPTLWWEWRGFTGPQNYATHKVYEVIHSVWIIAARASNPTARSLGNFYLCNVIDLIHRETVLSTPAYWCGTVPNTLSSTVTSLAWIRISMLLSRLGGRAAHPASCTMGTGFFPGGIAAEAWQWPLTPSIAEAEEGIELYFYSPSGPSCPVTGLTFHLLFFRRLEPLFRNVTVSCRKYYNSASLFFGSGRNNIRNNENAFHVWQEEY